MRMLIIFAATCLLVACNTGEPSDIGDQALADGDWGWDDGGGCMEATSIVRLSGDRIAFIEAGETVLTGGSVERELVYSDRMAGVRGRLESTRWTYNIWDENREALQVRDTYTVRYLGGQFRGLTFATREHRRTRENFRRVRGNDLPRGTLVPCPASAS
jgi:hypothetical protein